MDWAEQIIEYFGLDGWMHWLGWSQPEPICEDLLCEVVEAISAHPYVASAAVAGVAVTGYLTAYAMTQTEPLTYVDYDPKKSSPSLSQDAQDEYNRRSSYINSIIDRVKAKVEDKDSALEDKDSALKPSLDDKRVWSMLRNWLLQVDAFKHDEEEKYEQFKAFFFREETSDDDTPSFEINEQVVDLLRTLSPKLSGKNEENSSKKLHDHFNKVVFNEVVQPPLAKTSPIK